MKKKRKKKGSKKSVRKCLEWSRGAGRADCGREWVSVGGKVPKVGRDKCMSPAGGTSGGMNFLCVESFITFSPTRFKLFECHIRAFRLPIYRIRFTRYLSRSLGVSIRDGVRRTGSRASQDG